MSWFAAARASASVSRTMMCTRNPKSIFRPWLRAFSDMPRIPIYQPYVNVAMQKNVSGYEYWFHRRLDYRTFVKA